MFAFVVYAMAVWYAAFHWRRQWKSMALVIAGACGLVLVGWLHHLLNVWTEGEIRIVVLQSMLYPYGMLVVAVGVYLARLPLKMESPLRCLQCNYDMQGLDDPEVVCPECGRRLHPPRHPAVRVNPEPVARKRRRRGPAPVVLRWPPVGAPAAGPVTGH